MSKLQQNFVSVVSHEFRTALTSIQGFSELLAMEDSDPQEVKSYASDIHMDATRLNRINTEGNRYIKGTGLGLVIIQEICELHHGKVWVESALGQGSTFHITLPVT